MLWRALILLGLLFPATGCVTSRPVAATPVRLFDFSKDTFSYANELVWIYHFDTNRAVIATERREPPPTYSHHCYPMAREARQFFLHARFDAGAAALDREGYRARVRAVMRGDGVTPVAEEQRVVIPGFASLREFSAAQGELLQAEGGGAWRSYFQRGNWRLLWPFSRAGQARRAEELARAVAAGRVPLLHLGRFPQLSINHMVLLVGAREEADAVRFAVYDPNLPERSVELVFERATRTFFFPQNDYFAGGRVDVYEIGTGGCY